MSAKRGVRAAWAIALTVEVKVSDGTITSSPGPKAAASQARCSAALQLLTGDRVSAPV